MQKTIDLLRSQLVGIRQGTVTPAVVDTVRIACYGGQSQLSHLALTERKGNGILVTPYDPTLATTIAKSLESANFKAYVFSKTSVMVSVPPPSGEDTQKIATHVRKLGEDSKIAIRSIRKKYRQGTEELDEKALQKLTDEAVKTIDQLTSEAIGRL